MDQLPRIPTPLHVRWREFRISILPVVVFCGVVAVVFFLWDIAGTPPNVLAEVEPLTANVISTQPGTLVSLNVHRFQRVTNGQEIGQVMITETNVLEASLRAIATSLEVQREQLELAQHRNDEIYERERLLYREQLAQQGANVMNMELARLDYGRFSNLWASSGGSNSPIPFVQVETALYKFLALHTNVVEFQKFLDDKAKTVPTFQIPYSNILAAVQRELAAQEARYRASTSNQVLRVPLTGTISVINHRQGERVMAGLPIVVVVAEKGQHILAYARQPISKRPETNDVVLVRKQTLRHESEYARIMEVGTQLDRIDPALLPSNIHVEMALPFLVTMPVNLNLSPGERVDIVLNPRVRKPKE